MAVRIRFTRQGGKNRPFYRVAVFDGRTPRDGAYLENLGTYDPLAPDKHKQLHIKMDRFAYWLTKGARMTEAIRLRLKKDNLLKDVDLYLRQYKKTS
jgi:small subunit ribosomal protein S16